MAVILFCPKGIQPPTDYQRGVNRLADYTDRFLLDGLKRWEYSAAVKTLFRRKANGDVDVFGVFGEKPPAQYTDASVHKEAIDRVIDGYKLEPKSHIWWVLGYKGPSPVRFEGFRGGQSPKYGGWAVANYDSRVVHLKAGTPVGTPLHREMALKGMIHELGHAFRLPHIGPRYGLKYGNTLMGPTHANFRRVTGRFVKDGYLSQAAAAMLVAHPVLRGRRFERRRVPQVRLSEGQISTDAKSGTVSVSGRVQSNLKPVFAIVADHSKKLPGTYWVRHYVSRIETDGQFEVEVTEPVKADGEYFLWFVFPSGELTGNGRMQGTGERGATKIPYRFQNGRWVTELK
ncbi:MAG: hypothetical protein AB8G99_18830 [Planctomycetaceae bacterium]